MPDVAGIPGYPGHRVSSDGTVYGIRKRGALKPWLSTAGYPMVRLSLGGKALFVHRLVAEAFIPNPEGKPEVNHKDGDRANCSAGNLEWVTRSENMRHSVHVLTRKLSHPKPVLVDGVRFESLGQAGAFLGRTPGAVSSAAKLGRRCNKSEVRFA